MILFVHVRGYVLWKTNVEEFTGVIIDGRQAYVARDFSGEFVIDPYAPDSDYHGLTLIEVVNA